VYKKKDIASHARALGLTQGDVVLIHSSYKKIGDVDGGALAVIDALIDVVLPDGALLFPNLNIPHEFTVANPPRWDLKRDPIRNLGIIPELFKFHYARYFSIHPTHAVMGVGKQGRRYPERP